MVRHYPHVVRPIAPAGEIVGTTVIFNRPAQRQTHQHALNIQVEFPRWCFLYMQGTQHLQIQYRKAMYLNNIYVTFHASGVTSEQLMSIGWTKAKELLPVVTVFGGIVTVT